MAEVDTGGGDSSKGVCSPLGHDVPGLLPPTEGHLGPSKLIRNSQQVARYGASIIQ